MNQAEAKRFACFCIAADLFHSDRWFTVVAPESEDGERIQRARDELIEELSARAKCADFNPGITPDRLGIKHWTSAEEER